MAYTLIESAKYADTPTKKGILQLIASETPLTQRLPFENEPSGSMKYMNEGTLPGVAWRGVNGSYTESTGTINPATEGTYILGGDADVDNYQVAINQGNPLKIAELKTQALVGKAKSAAIAYTDGFINGSNSVNPLQFDGLKTRLTGTQVVAAGADGINVYGASDDERMAFLMALNKLIARVPGCNVLFCNADVLAMYQGLTQKMTIQNVTLDAFGNATDTYRGIPFVDIGLTSDQSTYILPQTEAQGTSGNVCSSIYAAKLASSYADRGVTGIQVSEPDSKDLGELDAKPSHRARFEWYPGLGVFGGKAAGRLTGVKAA